MVKLTTEPYTVQKNEVIKEFDPPLTTLAGETICDAVF